MYRLGAIQRNGHLSYYCNLPVLSPSVTLSLQIMSRLYPQKLTILPWSASSPLDANLQTLQKPLINPALEAWRQNRAYD